MLQMVSAGTTIIKQGDTDATKFYVLEKGTCDVLVTNDSTGGVPKKVHTYPSGRCAAGPTCSASPSSSRNSFPQSHGTHFFMYQHPCRILNRL